MSRESEPENGEWKMENGVMLFGNSLVICKRPGLQDSWFVTVLSGDCD